MDWRTARDKMLSWRTAAITLQQFFFLVLFFTVFCRVAAWYFEAPHLLTWMWRIGAAITVVLFITTTVANRMRDRYLARMQELGQPADYVGLY